MDFLNSGKGYELYELEALKDSYIDKSILIDAVFQYALRTNRYICVTRPRRFGKSTAANMIAAFFEKSTSEKSRKLFERLAIGKIKERQMHPEKGLQDGISCWKEQGKKNVIRINMINSLTPEITSYKAFYKSIKEKILEDLKIAYPEIKFKKNIAVSDALALTKDRFVIVIDEWDAVFEMKFMSEMDKEEYILFLKALLKDQSYVYFAYMTGILPIAKYSSGSPLNMFEEFSTFGDDILYPYFGLTSDEIDRLMKEKNYVAPTLEEMEMWYDGYISGKEGIHLYNPASVSKALANRNCRNYWSGTGPMNEVREIIRNNVQSVREDVIRMTGGEILDIKLTGFSVEKTKVSTRDEILSAMVVYGFLTYNEQKLRIPNHELMLKFQEALSSEELGLKQTIDSSKKLLEATLERRHNEVATLLEELHDEKIPFFKYNDENSLACVVTLGYIAAIDDYKISREDKAGKGYVDFTFTPRKKSDTAIILELKYNHSAKTAIKCIHDREYIKLMKGYKKVLLVGINYSEKTKKHTCLTELVEQ